MFLGTQTHHRIKGALKLLGIDPFSFLGKTIILLLRLIMLGLPVLIIIFYVFPDWEITLLYFLKVGSLCFVAQFGLEVILSYIAVKIIWDKM